MVLEYSIDQIKIIEEKYNLKDKIIPKRLSTSGIKQQVCQSNGKRS